MNVTRKAGAHLEDDAQLVLTKRPLETVLTILTLLNQKPLKFKFKSFRIKIEPESPRVPINAHTPKCVITPI